MIKKDKKTKKGVSKVFEMFHSSVLRKLISKTIDYLKLNWLTNEHLSLEKSLSIDQKFAQSDEKSAITNI